MTAVELLSQERDPAVQPGLDRLHRDPEPRRDPPRRETVEVAQQDRLAVGLAHPIDRGHELAMHGEALVGLGAGLDRLRACDRPLARLPTRAQTAILERQVAQHRREPAPHRRPPGGRMLQRPRPGLLDEILGQVLVAHQPPGQRRKTRSVGEQILGMEQGFVAHGLHPYDTRSVSTSSLASSGYPCSRGRAGESRRRRGLALSAARGQGLGIDRSEG